MRRTSPPRRIAGPGASRGISPRSAISSRAAGMTRARRSCASAPTIRTTCWRCRPATRSTSSPAMPGMLRDRIARALAEWPTEHAGLSRAARHACLRPRGDGRLWPGRGHRPPRRRARAARRLGAACRGACAGDAGPHRRRHRLDARQSRRTGAATASSPCTIGGTSRSYHLDRGETDEVLRLFDGPIFGARSTVAMDLVDASALLWRLHLRGIGRRRPLEAGGRQLGVLRPAPATMPSTTRMR